MSDGTMNLVATIVTEDQVTYTWERTSWESVGMIPDISRRVVERCTVKINRHSDESGIPMRDDPGWQVVE
jgi:hypothetical protein